MSPRLHSIRISDFRSIRGEILVPLDAPVVLIHGPNGAGKTSILSALELALTGSIPSLGRAEPDYAAHLVHKQAQQGLVSVKVDGLNGGPAKVTLPVTSTGPRGRPLFSGHLAKFYSERCYLPQSVLGRLLELYQVEATKSDTPLTEFVKDLLGLDQLDALIDGLHSAGDVRRLRTPVPRYSEIRTEIQDLQRSIRTDEAALRPLRDQIEQEEATLRRMLAELDPTLTFERDNIESLRRQLSQSTEERDLTVLASVRRNLQIARNEWRGLAAAIPAEQRQLIESHAAATERDVQRWRNSTGRELEQLVQQASALFPNLPASAATNPELARTTALRAVEKEHDRCANVLTQDDADTKRFSQLDQDLARAQGRGVILDREIAALAADSGALAQALAGIAPHIHTDDCPVCGRDFKEVSTRPLSAHVSTRITALTQNAGRLQALSQEKASITATVAQVGRERAQVAGRQISQATRTELRDRRAQLEVLKRKLEEIAGASQEGFALITRASEAARNLDVLRSRDSRVTNFKDTLSNYGQALAIENLNLDAPIENIMERLQTALAEQESKLGTSQARRRLAISQLADVASLAARTQQTQTEIANRQSILAKLTDAKAEADERIDTARELARAAREVRTAVVRRVFNDTLNLIWQDLFVRLAPEEPFVPAFALPATSDGPVEAILETHYRSGGKGGNPRAMLSAGNLNTAALTLFLSLHLSVAQQLPWLIIDDPVQSMDEVHIAQFAALLRTLSKGHGRQIILAIHERSLFDYLTLELSPAFSDDRLITIQLGQAPDGNTLCDYEPLTWSPDPAFAAA